MNSQQRRMRVRALRARVRVDIQPWRDSSAGPHVSCEHAPDRWARYITKTCG